LIGARGLAAHVMHVRAVESTTVSLRASKILLLLGLAGIALAGVLWWLAR
jgi:hypothetical protein